MNRFILSLITLLATALCAEAQIYDIQLKNGSKMQVQVCSPQIFRVKITTQDSFPESLMERYGILKTDWDFKDGSISQTSRKATISNGRSKLVINKEDGSLAMISSDGKTIVEKVQFIGSGEPLVTSLGEVLNERFKGYNLKGGIIGDPGHEQFVSLDIPDAGDFAQNSIISFSLKDGERFYGGGSTSREHIQHRGEILRMFATYQKTEIPIPFMLSSGNWGVLNNTTVRNYFDIGVTDKDRMNIYNTTSSADFYLFDGDSMNDVINLYTTVTGKTYVLPRYAYGFAFGPNMLENMFEFTNDALRFREERIPCDVMWIEPQWMSKYYDFTTKKNWNYNLFPGEPYWEENSFPKHETENLFIGRLHELGYKLALWLCIDFDQSLPEEDAIAAREGRPQSGQEHWFDHLTRFIDQGVDGFKLDPGRTLNEHADRQYYNGRTDDEMHNLNQVLMPKQMEQTFRGHTGKRSFHHYCAGYAGTQHWSACSSGDNGGSRTALFDQLNLNFCGFMNTSCDVMYAEDEMASLHMGAFLPWIQVNSWFAMLHPWYLSPKKKQMYADYLRTRYDLIPYIYSAALKCAQFGNPILQSMPLAFPGDRNVDDMVYQYMFGESLLVGVFSDEIYLPEGGWINFWTGEKVIGTGATVKCEVPDNRAGLLFIKDGAIIPNYKGLQYISDEIPTALTLRVYPCGKSSYTMYEDDGISYRYEDGFIAATRYDCQEADGAVKLVINATQGSFDGMPAYRDYSVEMYSEAKPAEVLLDGRPVSTWSWEDKCLKVSFKQPDVRVRTTLEVR